MASVDEFIEGGWGNPHQDSPILSKYERKVDNYKSTIRTCDNLVQEALADNDKHRAMRFKNDAAWYYEEMMVIKNNYPEYFI